MNNRHSLIATVILSALALASCRGETSPSVEETSYVSPTPEDTQIAPQTIESPQIAQKKPIITAESKVTITVEPTMFLETITIQVDSSSVKLDPAYFDGIIVLTKYYTLLDHGLYEEVLPLYSSSLINKTGGKNFEADLNSVELRGIQPYEYWLAQQGQLPKPNPENELRYIVYTTVFHKAPAWNVGGTPMPDNQTRYVSLILENGDWKLFEFNSSPWFP